MTMFYILDCDNGETYGPIHSREEAETIVRLIREVEESEEKLNLIISDDLQNSAHATPVPLEYLPDPIAEELDRLARKN